MSTEQAAPEARHTEFTSAPATPPRTSSTARALWRGFGDLVRRDAWNVLLLTLGGLLSALAFDLFLAPGDVAPGGISGLTLVVTNFLPLPNGATMLALNVPLLIIGARTLGGASFLLRTTWVILVTTVAIDGFALVLPAEGISDDGLLNALYGGVLGGVAAALALRGYGNLGGTTILGRVLQRRTGAPLGQIYLFTDGLIVLALGATFGWERALYSMVALFIFGLASDYAYEGPSVVRVVFIVTDQPALIAAALQARLNTGVTAWRGEGMYQRGERTVLFCTVNRAEVRELSQIVQETDPDGFITVGQGHRALGGTIGTSNRPG